MEPRETHERMPVGIVGAGPVGLALALGLARHGVRSVVLERRPGPNTQSRAPALHTRSLEILRQWGVDEAFLAAGALRRSLPIHPGPTSTQPTLSFDFRALDDEAANAGVLFLEQAQTEQLLLEAVQASGRCEVRFASEVTDVEQRGDRVELTVASTEPSPDRIEAEFVVGCDGASSFVRHAVGLSYAGTSIELRPLLADVEISDARDTLPWPRFHNGRRGITGAQRLGPGHWRIIRVEAGHPTPDEPVEDQEVLNRVAEVLGPGPAPVRWASRFQFQRRTANRFRERRVLLAGDAAHVFPPVNGHGMNAGIQDAHNLAWKLAVALGGGDQERLLASYDQERRAVVGTVSRGVNRLTRVGIQTPRSIRAMVVWLMRVASAVPPMRVRRARAMAMVGLHLSASALLPAGSGPAGRRVPNPVLTAPDGTRVRLYDVLPLGAAVLDLSGNRPRPELPVDATVVVGSGGYHDESGRLRRLVDGAPGWVLVRPDRHVAWVRTEPDGLVEATRHALGL